MGEQHDRPDDGSLSPDDFLISTRRAADEAAKQHETLRQAREHGLTESPSETLDDIGRLADATMKRPANKPRAERLEKLRLDAEKYKVEVGGAIFGELLNAKPRDLAAGAAAEKKATAQRSQPAASETAPGRIEHAVNEKNFVPLKQLQSEAERAGQRGIEVSDEAMTIEGRFVVAYNDLLSLDAHFRDLIFERSGNVEASDVERVNQTKIHAVDIADECREKKRLLRAQLIAQKLDAAQNTLDEIVELMRVKSEELVSLQDIVRRRIQKYQPKP